MTTTPTSKAKAPKSKKASKSSQIDRQIITSLQRYIVPTVINRQDERLISRYSDIFRSEDLRQFVEQVVKSTLRWMDRMVNGANSFELHTMDYWNYNPKTYILSMKNNEKGVRDYDVAFDLSFASGSIDEYNAGMGRILSSFWYKIDATPCCIVELVACCDLIYRLNHNGNSPASDENISHVDLVAGAAT
jgi:hypothetical protein